MSNFPFNTLIGKEIALRGERIPLAMASCIVKLVEVYDDFIMIQYQSEDWLGNKELVRKDRIDSVLVMNEEHRKKEEGYGRQKESVEDLSK